MAAESSVGLTVSLAMVIAPAGVMAAPTAAPAPRVAREAGFVRDGFAFGVAIGPAVFYGGGELDDVGGVGTSAALRFATTATATLMWVLDIEVGNYVVEIVDQANPSDRTTTIPTFSTVTLGGRIYAHDALWLEAGVGGAGFFRSTGNGVRTEASRKSGMVVTGSVGYDLFRRGPIAIDAELGLRLASLDGSGLVQGNFALGAMWF